MILNSPYISGSLTVTGATVLSGSVTLASGASIAGTASLATTALTASSVANLNQNVVVTGSLTTTGQIVAQTLNVQQVTSSIVYSSGSNIFGNSQSNVQQFTGSVLVTGSMGIGTSSPTNGRLEIQTGATTAGLWVQTGGTTSGYTVADFRTGTNLSALQILGNGAATFGSSVTATQGIFSENSGNVILQALKTGATNATTAIIRQTGAGGNGGQDIGLLVDIQGANDSDNIVNFRYYNGSTYTSRMVVKRNGFVGIGTTDPASASGAYGSLDIRGSGGGGIVVGTTTTLLGYVYGDVSGLNIQTAASKPILFIPNGNESVRIGATANQYDLMIGCTSVLHPAANRGSVSVSGPSSSIYSLGINGVAKAYLYHGGTQMYLENSASGGNVYVIAGGAAGVVLNAGATAWSSNSDERLKDINSNIENALDKLSTLRAVNFSWKSDSQKKENLGLIAQDVKKVFPQVVDEYQLPAKPDQEQTDETEYLGVRYTELIPVLVKAIQEQQALIESLKARIEVLESK